MQKKLLICLVVILLIVLPVGAYAQMPQSIQMDGMKVEYMLPSGWEEVDSGYEDDSYYKEYIAADENANDCIIMVDNQWNYFTEDEKEIFSREDINNDYMGPEYLAEGYDVPVEAISTVAWNGIDYYEINLEEESGDFVSVVYTYIENAVSYSFYFGYYDGDDAYYEDLVSLMDSVTYSYVQETGAALAEESGNAAQKTQLQQEMEGAQSTEEETDFYDFNGWDILFSLILTILVYSFPIIIYRYMVRKKPVEPGKAKKITIIYAVCAFVAMIVLMVALGGTANVGWGIFLWSFINYAMLTGGYKKYMEAQGAAYGGHPPDTMGLPGEAAGGQKKEAPPAKEREPYTNGAQGTPLEGQPEAEGGKAFKETTLSKSDPDGKFCIHCGKKIPEYSHFCPECGERQEEMTFSYEPLEEAYCMQCGEKIPANCRFCPKCGAEQKEK